MKKIVCIALCLTLLSMGSFAQESTVKGWIILSNHIDHAIETIKSASEYGINHLQLSHHIVHDLREVKNKSVQEQVNILTCLAHEEGIDDVFLWDHSFYPLDYYPSRFKTGPGGKIDLDNQEFWEWYKEDYRKMLDLVPDIDGLILTFIETGAYAEKQHSVKMPTAEEKLAAVVNAVADVVIHERGKKLYIRTFAYSQEEYAGIVGCIRHIRSDKVGIMIKEVPHDFFMTHPNNSFIGKFDRPTIVEFDTGNEYNGQGVIANTWPEYIMKRWKAYINQPNVIGYAARTDRYGTTKIIGTPNEILLYTLKRVTEDPGISVRQIYDEFIRLKYGKHDLLPIKNAFQKSYDIVTSVLYILGTNLADHSSLNYDTNKWSYNRHVSGRWMDPPVVFVEHGINKEFHYWKDIINHISPQRYKTSDSPLATEAKYALDNYWIDPLEKMDSVYYHYILTEKQYGVQLASDALAEIKSVHNKLKPSDYEELFQLFNRTYLTAQLHEAVCAAYFGFRIYTRERKYHPVGLDRNIHAALDRIVSIAKEMNLYRDAYPVGQYDWLKDADKALQYREKIMNGWAEYGGLKLSAVYPGGDEKSLSRSQYFSWINNTNEGPTEEQTLINLTFFDWLKQEYGMIMDIYAFDAGFIDGKNFYGTMDSERFKKNFPNGLSPVFEKARLNNTRLGLWGGPDGFGDSPEEAQKRKDMLVSLCRDYHWALFKFDAVCGPLRRDKEDDFIDLMQQCRIYSPDLILLNHRLGLDKAKPYATTFLWEGREAYIDVNAKNNTTAPHNRAGIMDRGLVPNLQRLTEDHGVCLSSCLDYWEDDLILHAFNRSLILAPQIYGNPWLLSDHEFPRLARIYNLHRRFSKLLVNGIVLPDNYGKDAVSRGDDETRLITLRNLSWEPKEFTLNLSREIGLNKGKQVSVRQFHPGERILGTFQYGESVKVVVPPFRSLLLYASTTNEYGEPGVEGIDFEIIKKLPNEPVVIKLLGFPGTKAHIRIANMPHVKKIEIDGRDITQQLKGQKSSKIMFEGKPLNAPYHRKMTDMTKTTVPYDAPSLYEATVFAADNNALEVRSLYRSGQTEIPKVKAARDAFFHQTAFINRGVWDKNLFDGNMNTGFWVSRRGGIDHRIKKGCFRLDLGETFFVDSIIVKVNNEYELQPLLTEEGNFAQVSTDLKAWRPITFLAGRMMNIPVSGYVRYLKLNPFPDAIAEIEVYGGGKKLQSESFRASNLFADSHAMKCTEAWDASFQLDEIAKNSYLSVAINGEHGVEGVYAALKVDGEYIGSPSRAVSYPANPWENFVAKSSSDYTYFFPLTEDMKNKKIEVFVLGYHPMQVKPEVWMSSYPVPYEEKVMVIHP